MVVMFNAPEEGPRRRWRRPPSGRALRAIVQDVLRQHGDDVRDVPDLPKERLAPVVSEVQCPLVHVGSRRAFLGFPWQTARLSDSHCRPARVCVHPVCLSVCLSAVPMALRLYYSSVRASRPYLLHAGPTFRRYCICLSVCLYLLVACLACLSALPPLIRAQEGAISE